MATDDAAEASDRLRTFVSDEARGRAPYAAVVADPLGGGRHLLLPLLRGLQRGAATCLALLQAASPGSKSRERHESASRSATNEQERDEGSGEGSRSGEFATNASPGSVAQRGVMSAVPTSGSDSATHDEAEGACGPSSAWRRYAVSAEEAAQRAQQMADSWQLDRAALLSGGGVAVTSETSSASPATGSSSSKASVMTAIRRAVRSVKRGVIAWDEPPGFEHDDLADRLAEEAEGSDVAAGQLLGKLRGNRAFLGAHREPPNLHAGGEAPADDSSQSAAAPAESEQDPAAARERTAAVQLDEREAQAFSRQAVRVRQRMRQHSGGQRRGPSAWHGERNAAGRGPHVRHVRAAAHCTGHDEQHDMTAGRRRVAAVAEGDALFAADAEGGGRGAQLPPVVAREAPSAGAAGALGGQEQPCG